MLCRRIVTVADPQKLMVFLNFVNDPGMMLESCRDAWLSLYDKEVQHTRSGLSCENICNQCPYLYPTISVTESAWLMRISAIAVYLALSTF